MDYRILIQRKMERTIFLLCFPQMKMTHLRLLSRQIIKRLAVLEFFDRETYIGGLLSWDIMLQKNTGAGEL